MSSNVEFSEISKKSLFSIFKNIKLDSDKIHNIFKQENVLSNEKNYWKELFNTLIKYNINVTDIKDWPDEFIETLDDYYKNILRSEKTINKFNLW